MAIRTWLIKRGLQDTFEDANDTAAIETANAVSVERSRSLTKRRSSSTKSPPHESDQPPVPAVPDLEKSDEETNGHTAHDEHDSTQPKSPLLTSHHLSITSLDNVNLEEDEDAVKPSTPTGRSPPHLLAPHFQERLTGNQHKKPPNQLYPNVLPSPLYKAYQAYCLLYHGLLLLQLQYQLKLPPLENPHFLGSHEILQRHKRNRSHPHHQFLPKEGIRHLQLPPLAAIQS